MNSIDAKQFLISRVVEEAELEQMSLSPVERKMLQFTEAHPTIPDIYEVKCRVRTRLRRRWIRGRDCEASEESPRAG